jgi:hypothetical protein
MQCWRREFFWILHWYRDADFIVVVIIGLVNWYLFAIGHLHCTTRECSKCCFKELGDDDEYAQDTVKSKK